MSKFINVICEQCGKEFRKTIQRFNEAVKNNWKQFCSSECKYKFFTKSQEVLCKFCGIKFIKKYNHLKRYPNNFCSHSCAAKYNNTKRLPPSIETKTKISMKLKGIKTHDVTTKQLETLRRNAQHRKKPLITTKCKICEKEFTTLHSRQRKTCSYNCQVIASTKIRTYQNGSRKSEWYFNPFENKKVLLESSWEVKVADSLCNINIKWIRPDPLSWIDSNGKNHLYFPDFFLPDYNTYLDPKNPYCMDRDKEKMKYFENKINLIYGKLSIILNYIEKIKSGFLKI